jgi:ATP-dependent DNA helicase RecG
MGSEEKDEVMLSFGAGDIDVLVATTVIEVGIDVPNASLMVILDAERFGVSQLHQLRGRVGRGTQPGTCLLVTHAEADTTARERVDAVASTLDGFELAAKDLELRSEGDVLGVRQSGSRSRLKLLRVTRDSELIDTTRRYAEILVEADPQLVTHPVLRGDIERRFVDGSREYLEKT